jgi:cytochrome c oxidase subunit 3
MSMWVAVVALCSGIFVWWLLARQLTAKPWEHHPAGEAIAADPLHGTQSTPAAKVGLCVFLVVVTALFGLFISAYFIRMGYVHGYGAKQVVQINDWRVVSEPPILWLNTVLLIVGSVVMQAAQRSVIAQQVDAVRRYLIAGGVLTLLFLAGQLTAWQQLGASGYVLGSNPAAAFFYVLTAVHGLHLLGGLFVGRTARLWRQCRVD